ncbi:MULTISPECIES: hypothetical protein [Aliivibrio]|uniref:Uncharacterized protein n=1 Tax=Aliivibrio finisterrensis TaxID=511998 RepID=A0A4Q5KKH0_9GAMM|nr:MULTISPECIES: hypothetical protein [Aliivibrio]MDD9180737.1 hypothetical protein [Aliivibrio sp. A6]RYU46797.1 hypothetical protein ERW57_19030 [Aliivibrio finisterrensis]RYU47436.1 hypothetical protein ERW56_19280 [Aliivibrio finisterrensis]RYU51958.1 hypothetical protein ERW50_19385 [Aliivibrio finisterrensis]RYU59570.1 hypothetical protein ERW53_19955 [Aliivibrio finisterrensis]
MEAKFTFYNIEKCGYYTFGSTDPIFSGVTDVFAKLALWGADGRELENTTTYEHDRDNEIMRTFYVDSATCPVTNDIFLTLWNEVENDNGKIYGMAPNKKPGNTEILETGFDGLAIPGFPSYFWFSPENNVFASIKFDHSTSGKKNLELYMNGFLSNKSPYRVFNEEDVVIGYSQDGKYAKGCDKNHPRFLAKKRKNNKLEAELLANLSNIRKFVKKESLLYSTPDDRQLIERVFSRLLDNPPAFSKSKDIMHEVAFEPSAGQLKKIISNFYDNEDETLKNAGFIYNTGKRVMLKGINVSFKFNLDVTKFEAHVINVEALLKAVRLSRVELLAEMENPISTQ